MNSEAAAQSGVCRTLYEAGASGEVGWPGTVARSRRCWHQRPRPPLRAAPLARSRDAVYQQLAGGHNVFTAVAVIPAVDVPPVEIRTIAFVTGVGQGDPVVLPRAAPRGDGNDDFHSGLYRERSSG